MLIPYFILIWSYRTFLLKKETTFTLLIILLPTFIGYIKLLQLKKIDEIKNHRGMLWER